MKFVLLLLLSVVVVCSATLSPRDSDDALLQPAGLDAMTAETASPHNDFSRMDADSDAFSDPALVGKTAIDQAMTLEKSEEAQEEAEMEDIDVMTTQEDTQLRASSPTLQKVIGQNVAASSSGASSSSSSASTSTSTSAAASGGSACSVTLTQPMCGALQCPHKGGNCCQSGGHCCPNGYSCQSTKGDANVECVKNKGTACSLTSGAASQPASLLSNSNSGGSASASASASGSATVSSSASTAAKPVKLQPSPCLKASDKAAVKPFLSLVKGVLPAAATYLEAAPVCTATQTPCRPAALKLSDAHAAMIKTQKSVAHLLEYPMC